MERMSLYKPLVKIRKQGQFLIYTNFLFSEDLYLYIEAFMSLTLSKKVQQLLKMFDLFSYNSFLRYKGQSQYKTSTGGFFSIVILIIFAILFTNLGIKTMQKQIISWSNSVSNQPQPTSTTVKLSPQTFMIAIQVFGVNLNDPNKRFFDVALNEKEFQAGYRLKSSVQLDLTQCTQQHFSATQKLKNSWNKTPNKQNWMCPRIGSSFQIFGKFTTEKMKYLQVQFKKCNNATDPTRPCATQAQIQFYEDNYGPFLLGLFFVNPLFNPGDIEYLDFALKDLNYVTFTSKLGVYANVYIQDYTIITDQSIMPFQQPRQQSGVSIPFPFQINHFVTYNSDLLASLMIFKADSSIQFRRSFYKIDQFFSYIGGLVGVILTGMFLLSFYNEYSYQNELGAYLYQKDEDIPSSNLWQFFKYSVYNIFKKCFTRCKNFKSLQKVKDVQQQIGRQLDLSLILERILFLQRSIQILFQKGQFTAMYLSRKLTVKQATLLRQNLCLRQFLLKNKKIKTQQQNQSSLNISNSVMNSPDKEKREIQFSQNQGVVSNQMSQDSDQESLEDQVKLQAVSSLEKFSQSLEEKNEKSVKISKNISWRQMNFALLQVKNEENSSNKSRGQQQKIQHLRQIQANGIIKVASRQQFQSNPIQFQFIDS